MVSVPLREAEERDVSERKSSSTNGNGGVACRKLTLVLTGGAPVVSHTFNWKLELRLKTSLKVGNQSPKEIINHILK